MLHGTFSSKYLPIPYPSKHWGMSIDYLAGRSMALMTSKVQQTVLLGNLCPGWPIDIYETVSHNQFHAITAICGHFHRPASIYKQFPTHQTLKNVLVCAHITHPSVMAWARHFCAVLSLFLNRVPSIILSLKLIMNHFPAVHSALCRYKAQPEPGQR